jgi:TonB family protein
MSMTPRLLVLAILGAVSCRKPGPAPAARQPEPCTTPVVLDDPVAPVYAACALTEPPERYGCETIPRYPSHLRQAGIQGGVLVAAVVDTLGRIEPYSIHPISASHNDFVEPALITVRSCRYRPGRLHARPVRVQVQIPVNFSITR